MANTEQQNVHQFTTYVDSVGGSTGPAYAMKTLKTNGSALTAKLQEVTLTRDTEQRTEGV